MSGSAAVNFNVALIALGGVIYTGAVALIVHYFTNRARDQELFQSALEFITGETQNRSVGISLLTRYSLRHQKKQGIILDIFRAQLLHLIDKDYGFEEGWERRIERYNYLLLREVVDALSGTKSVTRISAREFYSREAGTH